MLYLVVIIHHIPLSIDPQKSDNGWLVMMMMVMMIVVAAMLMEEVTVVPSLPPLARIAFQYVSKM